MEKCLISRERVIVPHGEATEVQQPRIRALDDLSTTIAAELATVLIADFPVLPMRHDQIDVLRLERLPQCPTVIAPIRDDAVALLLRAAGAAPRDRYRRERCFGELAFGAIGRRKVHSERNTRAVDQYYELCALAFACFADASAPFFAGANVPSRKASLQSGWCRSSNSLKKARHILSHTSCASHSPKRRQHVTSLGHCGGISRHRAPVRKIYRIPSRQARSSARGRPPFGRSFWLGQLRCNLHPLRIGQHRLHQSLAASSYAAPVLKPLLASADFRQKGSAFCPRYPWRARRIHEVLVNTEIRPRRNG